MQTRFGSFIETLVNTTIGWFINLVANLLVLPAFGYPVTVRDALGIGVVFTVISVVRGFFVRRAFNSRPMRRLFDR